MQVFIVRIENDHYGRAISAHNSAEAAEQAYAELEVKALQETPDAIVDRMYTIWVGDARVGERIRLN